MPRCPTFVRLLQPIRGFGVFDQKNLFEALLAHELWLNPTPDEIASVRNGPGAETYWAEVGIDRGDMVSSLHGFIDYFGQDTKVIGLALAHEKRQRKYSLSDLGLCKHTIDDTTAQFWACAQGRIHLVWNNVSRTKAEPVPWYLLPNKTVMEKIRDAWASL